ncbi:MAG: 30S ribosomal protein S5, partial [Nitrosopumilus sp.]|nr:30S ribosomal protein S5 [Nitrosopumilus sp.]
MSQATQSKGPQGRGTPVYGRGPPGGQKGGNDRPRRPRREPEEEVWVPKTILGQKVASGEISSLE